MHSHHENKYYTTLRRILCIPTPAIENAPPISSSCFLFFTPFLPWNTIQSITSYPANALLRSFRHVSTETPVRNRVHNRDSRSCPFFPLMDD
ncbi:BCN_G0011370.mRNA.1.CDS.1 [Saccharomyces cerevisiae]|nr:BCN_G0011370.mRNA.1.CDS.1 [Saccharomyces cerevisiae]CAI4360948.1 BCE_3a_G0011180.mRNA.1.CDS.1 [Saccharomyces cerevisiae]CAI7076931.1 BCN_G0011370.mRNA.1.CDS.1 [Saccharomyces cerevisiae]CAI7077064.1 BCE_3a_G0011180.mRNA.1.CDS.1 [Saccharomyces cerevisiae]